MYLSLREYPLFVLHDDSREGVENEEIERYIELVNVSPIGKCYLFTD